MPKKKHPMAQTDGHGDSVTESAQWGGFSENENSGLALKFRPCLLVELFSTLKACGPTISKPSLYIFKASALWANAFYKSICPSVRLFTFEVPFKRLFAPTS